MNPVSISTMWCVFKCSLASLLGSKFCLPRYILIGGGKLHGHTAVSYIMLWHKRNSPVDEYCVAVTLHVSWDSVPSNSPAAPKSTFMHSCHQHAFECFLFMLVTLPVVCFQLFVLTQRDVTAEVERSAFLALQCIV